MHANTFYSLHIPLTSVPPAYSRLEQLCTLQNARVNFYTIPVLINGHVQHTETLAKSHTSVWIKYGVNKFQFKNLFFTFYYYFQYLSPVGLIDLKYKQWPSKCTLSLLPYEMVHAIWHTKKSTVLWCMHPGKNIIYGVFFTHQRDCTHPTTVNEVIISNSYTNF